MRAGDFDLSVLFESSQDGLLVVAGVDKANSTLQQLMQLSDYIESAEWTPVGPLLQFDEPTG